MIDITPYQQKLTWLQEWIRDCIDGGISPPIWINVGMIPSIDLSMEDVLRIWHQTGVMFYNVEDVVESTSSPISFEQFCALKTTARSQYKIRNPMKTTTETTCTINCDYD